MLKHARARSPHPSSQRAYKTRGGTMSERRKTRDKKTPGKFHICISRPVVYFFFLSSFSHPYSIYPLALCPGHSAAAAADAHCCHSRSHPCSSLHATYSRTPLYTHNIYIYTSSHTRMYTYIYISMYIFHLFLCIYFIFCTCIYINSRTTTATITDDDDGAHPVLGRPRPYFAFFFALTRAVYTSSYKTHARILYTFIFIHIYMCMHAPARAFFFPSCVPVIDQAASAAVAVNATDPTRVIRLFLFIFLFYPPPSPSPLQQWQTTVRDIYIYIYI